MTKTTYKQIDLAGFVVGDRIVLDGDLATITSLTADFAKAITREI